MSYISFKKLLLVLKLFFLCLCNYFSFQVKIKLCNSESIKCCNQKKEERTKPLNNQSFNAELLLFPCRWRIIFVSKLLSKLCTSPAISAGLLTNVVINTK